MKIALDNQISPTVKLPGHEIVTWAGDDEDEVWIKRAVEKGAEVFVSPDLDVPNILDHNKYDGIFIQFPQKLKGKGYKAEQFLLRKLKRLV